MSFTCGSGVMDSCVGTTFYLDKEADGTLCSSYSTRQLQEDCIIGNSADLVAEVIYVTTFAITIALTQFSSSLSKNMVKGLNALRCAALNGGVNAYNLVAAAYFAARQFGQAQKLQDLINEYFPYLCTCMNEVEQMGEWFGTNPNAGEFKSCN